MARQSSHLQCLHVVMWFLVSWMLIQPWPTLAAPASSGQPPPNILADPRALLKWKMQMVLEDRGTAGLVSSVRETFAEQQQRYRKLADEYNAKGEPEPARQAALASNLAVWYTKQLALLDQVLAYKRFLERQHRIIDITPAQRQDMLNQAKTEMPRLLAELKQIYEQPPNR